MKDQASHTLKTRSGDTLLARRLAEGDAPALQRFHENLSETTRASFTPHRYDEATIGRYIRRAREGEDRIYVLCAGDDIVGYFFLWEFQTPIPLLGIGLADACQGEGLGAQMMTILIEDARAAGREGIELTTLPHNDRAFALYRKMEFHYVGDVDNVAGDGRVVVERKMFLPLEEGAQPSDREFKPPA